MTRFVAVLHRREAVALACVAPHAPASSCLGTQADLTRTCLQPFTPVPIAIDSTEHLLALVSSSATANTSIQINPFEPVLHPTREQVVAKVNLLSQIFKNAPEGAIPPPPQNVDKNRSAAVNKLKEDGNVSLTFFLLLRPSVLKGEGELTSKVVDEQAKFKAKAYKESIIFYSQALMVAASRMPWESSAIIRDELSIVLCNRAAAYGAINEVWSSPRPLALIEQG